MFLHSISRIGDAIALIRDRDRRDRPHAQQRREIVVDPLMPSDSAQPHGHLPGINRSFVRPFRRAGSWPLPRLTYYTLTPDMGSKN